MSKNKLELLQKAQDLLKSDASQKIVLVSESEIISSKYGGVVALLALFGEQRDLSEFCVADRVVGKAAAMLLTRLNVGLVHAELISKSAREFFDKHEVKYSFDVETEFIRNRAGDGMCPLESVVVEFDDIDTAIIALQYKMKELLKQGEGK